MLQQILAPREFEEYSYLIASGEIPFKALAEVTDSGEAFRELAYELGYEFANTLPSEVEEVSPSVFTDGRKYYTFNPALAPDDRPVVVVPPKLTRVVEISETEIDDFWVRIVLKAVKEGWGDIHFEPSNRTYRVRVRNNVGEIEQYMTLSKKSGESLLQQLLVKAGIKIENRRVAKDGSIYFADIESKDPAKKETVKFLTK
jgi:hypothetical protein